MNLNKAMIIGNLTRDPEIRTTPSGQSVVNFGVATNLIWTNASGEKQKKTEYHNIVAWRKLADICAQYLKKGNKVYIEGRLQTREWQGQDGVKRQRTEIIAENMIMLDRKRESAATTDESQSETTPETSSSPLTSSELSKSESEEEIKVEDIPF